MVVGPNTGSHVSVSHGGRMEEYKLSTIANNTTTTVNNNDMNENGGEYQ